MPREYTSLPIDVRFWRYVDKNGPVPEHAPELGPCWPWTASLTKGYGQMRVGNRQMKSHRVSWMLHTGAWPDEDKLVMHKCDNPKCVRPDHLRLGTPSDNSTDRDVKRRRRRLCGEEHPNSKLTAEDVSRIRLSAGSARHLANELGVARSTVSAVRGRKVWTHVD